LELFPDSICPSTQAFLGGVGYGNLHLRELATLKVVVCPRPPDQKGVSWVGCRTSKEHFWLELGTNLWVIAGGDPAIFFKLLNQSW